MSSLFPLLLFFLGGGRKPSPAVYLRFRVANDDVGVRFLQLLESRGTVKALVDFDGSNLEVIWAGHDGGVYDLPEVLGVELLEVRLVNQQ